MVEWLRLSSAKAATLVRIQLGAQQYWTLAQRQSTSLTWKGSRSRNPQVQQIWPQRMMVVSLCYIQVDMVRFHVGLQKKGKNKFGSLKNL